MTYFTVGLLLFLYLAYVAVVAVADISKRAGVDWSVIGHNLALRMQGKAGLTTPLLSQHRAAGDASVSGGLPAGPLRPSAATGSNGHLGPTVTELHPPSYKHSNSGGSAHSSGDAASEVEMMATSQPVSPSRSAPGALLDSLVPLEEPALRSNGAQNGAQRSHTAPPPSAAAHERKHEAAHRAAGSAVGYEELVHMSAQEYRRRALADMAAAKSFYRRRPAPGLDIEGPTLLEGEEYGEESDSEGEGAVDGDGVQLERGEYVPPDLSTLTAQPPPAPAPPRPGHARDLQGRAVAAYHRQVASFKENAPHEPVVKFVEAAISPLMLLIKATIPIVETESYDRFWFLIALAFSPLFICLYLGKLTFGAVALAELLGIAASLVCLVATSHAPETPPFWDFGTGFPIGAGLVALYSFAIAAMWIDMFASEIVGILHFLGILASVNPAVLGVTVLAWGNSLTDFIANTNMAGKSAGGTSMAMTACFAGPLFNMLVGLGLGFWMLLADTKERFAMVTFDPVVLVGCIFAMVNCAGVAAVAVLNGHWLPGRFGWSMIVWYGIYMAVIIVVVTFS